MSALVSKSFTRRVAFVFFLANSILFASNSPDSLILNYQYFVDWVRADVGSHFKKKDAVLMPNSLLKIDLSSLPTDLQLERASLHLYAQQSYRPDFSQIIGLYLVEDNTWDSDKTISEEIYSWPASEILSSFIAGQPGWKSFDITEAARKALQQNSGILSVKYGLEPNIAPLGWDIMVSPSWDLAGKLDSYDNSNLRPFVKIVYTGTTQLPDFHIGSSDVRIEPRLARPGDTVTLQAKIHNFGGQETAPVAINFFDLFGRLIGTTQMTTMLPAVKGIDSVSVSWTVAAGVQHVRAQVDPEGEIAEMRETNNTILKSFLISDNYTTHVDDFESPEFSWTADFDLPVEQNALGDHPMKWLILPQEGLSYSGSHSILLYLDGTRDDGTIWIERSFPVEPFSNVRVSTEFFARDPFVGIQGWAIVGYAGAHNPEDEVVFEPCSVMSASDLWKRCVFTKEIFTGPASEVWLALGIWARWEVAETFYFDLISVNFDTGVQTGVETVSKSILPKNWVLRQNHPNPFTHNTRIDCHVPENGSASLRIVDVLGREVRRFNHGISSPSDYVEFFWDGANATGEDLPNGIYFYSIWAGQKSLQTRKMLKIK